LPYSTAPAGDGDALPIEIASLMHPAADDHSSRGGPALFALALLAADGLALSVMRRRRITAS
jgi:hypothetical protein